MSKDYLMDPMVNTVFSYSFVGGYESAMKRVDLLYNSCKSKEELINKLEEMRPHTGDVGKIVQQKIGG